MSVTPIPVVTVTPHPVFHLARLRARLASAPAGLKDATPCAHTLVRAKRPKMPGVCAVHRAFIAGVRPVIGGGPRPAILGEAPASQKLRLIT